jgi:hypothetical protein
LEKVVTFAPTVATLPNAVPFVERWIVKPVSLLELSVHDKLILDLDAAVPVRLLGATGVAVAVGVGVGVAVAVAVGVGLGVGVGVEIVLLIWTIFAFEGIPFEFRMNSM